MIKESDITNIVCDYFKSDKPGWIGDVEFSCIEDLAIYLYNIEYVDLITSSLYSCSVEEFHNGEQWVIHLFYTDLGQYSEQLSIIFYSDINLENQVENIKYMIKKHLRLYKLHKLIS